MEPKDSGSSTSGKQPVKLVFEGHLNMGGFRLEAKDFDSIDEGLLDDNVIYFFMELLRQTVSEENKDQVEIIGPAVTAFLCSIPQSKSESELLEAIRPLNLTTKKIVLIVINDLEEVGHWSLLVFVPPGRFFHLDSINQGNKKLASRIATRLSKAFGMEEKIFEEMSDCTRQSNHIDCGLFVIENSRKVLDHILVKGKSLTEPFQDPVSFKSREKRRELKLWIQRLADERDKEDS